MKFIARTFRMMLLLIAAGFISAFIGGMIGFIVSCIYISVFWSVLAWCDEFGNRNSKKTVLLPGDSILFEAKQPFGVNVNGREFMLRTKEQIEVTIPANCSAVGLMFAGKYDDSILDAQELTDNVN